MKHFCIVHHEELRIEAWKSRLDCPDAPCFNSPVLLLNALKYDFHLFSEEMIFILDRMYNYRSSNGYDLAQDKKTWKELKQLVPARSKLILATFTYGSNMRLLVNPDLIIDGTPISREELSRILG